MPGMTLSQARQRTTYPVGRLILQTITVTDEFWSVAKFESANSANSHTYNRRQGEVKANWVKPGQLIQKFDTVETAPVTVQLAQAVNKFGMPSYVQDNMNDPFDQATVQIVQALSDLGRDVALTGIQGIRTDVCQIQVGGGVTAANINGNIVPGPYHNHEIYGPGSLKFDLATSSYSYRAPGDQEYGVPVVVAANAGPYTVASKSAHMYLTFSTAGLPAADAHTNVLFSSTTNQPDGLINLVDPSMLVAPTDAVNGDPISFGMIDRLISKMGKFWNPRECAIVMHSNLFNALLERGRLGGGVTFKEITMESGVTLQSYRGAPVIQSDYMPTAFLNGKPSHHLFVANMNPEVGFCGVSAGSMTGQGLDGYMLMQGSEQRFSGGAVAGWKVKALGPAREFDGEESMVTWTGAFCVKARQSVSARYGVTA